MANDSGKITRRLLVGATATTALAFGAAKGETISGSVPWKAGEADRPDAADPRQGYLFFDANEAAFIEAAVSRLIPKDELGPGALEAGVAVFIDRQLAGPYGKGDHFYLKGPFPHGEPTQGWQAKSPAEVYRAAIVEVNRYAMDQKNAAFAKLTPEDQDAILKSLESGDAKLKNDVDSKAFFAALLQNTIEGFFSDPLYGGNRDMAGWKLIGFPGAHYDYRDYVRRHGQAVDIAPVGLMGKPGWERS